MVNLLRNLLLISCASILLTCCSVPSGDYENDSLRPQRVSLSCIAVLPATVFADNNDTLTYSEAQSLEKGATYTTDVMRGFLQGKSGVHFMRAGLQDVVTDKSHKICDGVLITSVRRYQQRQGTEYAVDAPAAVDFFMVLKHVESGKILWTTEFQERQQSLLSNILTFGKARERGFKWVTAEQLMEQGLKDRLTTCPYLK